MSEFGKAVQWAAKAVLLMEAFGRSDRAVKAWAWREADRLRERAFSSRESVRARSTYVNLGAEAFIQQTRDTEQLAAWIWGPGGTGKSTLAFELGRRAAEAERFIPVLIDFTWRGPLDEHVASCLGPIGGSLLPSEVVARMLRNGLVGLIVDGVSEIQRAGAVEELADGVRGRRIRHVVVTSRGSPPPETFKAYQLGNLTRKAQRDLVVAHVADPARREATCLALEEFAVSGEVSPLFARLAIDRFVDTGHLPEGLLALAQDYLFSLRKHTSGELSEPDLLRACRVAGFACVEGSFTPHAVDEAYLRGTFDTEGARSAFLTGAGARLSGADVIRQLTQIGVLHGRVVNVINRVDFVHHPLAEQLAAAHISTLPKDERAANLAEVKISEASQSFKNAVEALCGGS